MNRSFLYFSLLTILALILAACGGDQAPQEVAPSPPPVSDLPLQQAGAEANPTPVTVDLAGLAMELGATYRYVDGTLLVAVPAGPFTMGHGLEDNPEHIVTLGDYWIYQTEVTNRQYAFCVASGLCAPPDEGENPDYDDYSKANLPVVGVDYDQAASYCGWVHGRLPTEAEWEKAARGPAGNIYPWGDNLPTCDLLNTANCVSKPTMVLTYPEGRSYYEAFDMAGNVYEWVADWFSATYYAISPAENPLGPEYGEKRSVRSSGFDRSFFEAESARRSSLKPIEHRNNLGFRCVVEDPLYFAPFCAAQLVYGVGPNGSPNLDSGKPVDCWADIEFSTHCPAGAAPYVTFSIQPASAVPAVIPAGCTGGPPVWTCAPGTTDLVVAKNLCDVPLPPDYICPPGSIPTGTGCNVEGRSGECLTGSSYDPVNQCCSGLEVNGIQFGCPVGWYGTAEGCAPFPASSMGSNAQNVPVASCEKPEVTDTDDTDTDDGETGGCPPGTSYGICGRDQTGAPIYGCC